jgi:tRNA dimethylallyltransferase
LAISLARALSSATGRPTEIVSADSRQIFRYMDVGTAKPTADQRGEVPHHLLDVVDPDQNLGLAQYQKLAYTAIDELHVRGGIPLLVGGTGQYLSAVIQGWTIPEVPPNSALRDELESFAAERGAAALYERLREYDPQAAARIDYRNVRRVVRALEVYLEAGQPISVLQRKVPPPYAILQFGLTLERTQLYQRADERLQQMLREGFVAEVRRLLDMGYSRSLPSMSALGYPQLASHLMDGLPLEVAIAEMQQATRDFIRRQYTWFRGHDSGILWHNIGNANVFREIYAVCSAWVRQG